MENTGSYFNTECPICFTDDSSSSFILTSCMHRLHLECAKNLTSLECPLCRSLINNYPKDINDIIGLNKKDRAEDLELQDRQALREIIEQNNRIIPERSLRIEIMVALKYLREQGIPLRYIPADITIKIHKSPHPKPPKGVIFCTIMEYIIKQIIYDLNYEISDDNLPLGENPFDEEDILGNHIERKVNVIEI